MSLSNAKMYELDNFVIGISKKLSNIEYVQNILGSNTVEYKSSSVAVSYPALCILFSELQFHFPECKFNEYAHQYLEVVNNYLGKNNVYDISLFDGLCGVGFAANCMSDNGRRYQSFIEKLNEYIVDIVDSNILKYGKMTLNEFCYDTMYGLTGTANYLLNFKSEDRVNIALQNILQYLTDICKIGDDGYPKFVLRADQSCLLPLTNNHRIRYVNLGVSHGIPGILLILCKTYEQGIYVSNQLETIRFVSEYIFDNCIKNNMETFWETQKIMGIEHKAIPSRDAWCYGTPGVAYSLLIASKLLKNEEMQNLAISSMRCSLKRLRDVISPTFCHGLSGLCCLARKFYECTSDNYFYEMYIELLGYILDSYNAKYPFGFKDRELEKGQIVDKDEIGILTGTSGVLLTILSCYKPVKTKWDSLFLL